MDPERVLQEAIALLAPKMPKGAVFKRSECLAGIRELQQTCSDTTIIDEFLRVVSSEPEKYVEGVSTNLDRSSVPATKVDPAYSKSTNLFEPVRPPGSSAPQSARSDQHMPIHDADRHEPIKMHSSTPASPKRDHAMMGTEKSSAERPRPAARSKFNEEPDHYVPLVVPPGSVLPKRKSQLREFFRWILNWLRPKS